MSKKIIIIGASGLGKEVAWLAHDCGYEVYGFLDDDANKKNIYGKAILGKISDWKKWINFSFVIAVGNPIVKKNIFEMMTQHEDCPSFATLIHPSVIMSKSIQVGEGTIICAGVVLTVDIIIKKNVLINIGSTIGHDCLIEDFVTIAPNVAISGNVTLEKYVEVGTGATIKQNLSLAKGSMLGMGSVLTKSIKERSLFFGIPAKHIKLISGNNL